MLDDVELSELENKYNKKTRAELNYSWNYQKLLCELAKIDELYEAQLGTIFSYSFSSHLIHYDYNGLILRNMPVLHASDDDSVDYDIAQALKILSNTLSFYLFRVVAYVKGNKCGDGKTEQIMLELLSFIEELDETQNAIVLAKAKKD